jgi:hypothetical protein
MMAEWVITLDVASIALSGEAAILLEVAPRVSPRNSRTKSGCCDGFFDCAMESPIELAHSDERPFSSIGDL